MKRSFTEELYSRLEAGMQKQLSAQNPVTKQLALAIDLIKDALGELRKHLEQNPFNDQAEEIHFFKSVKPRFNSLYIFYVERYQLQNAALARSKEQLQRYYQEELALIRRFLARHPLEEQYDRLELSQFDDQFFVRGSKCFPISFPEIAEPDPLFSTSHDYLFSKIRAYRMLQEHLLALLDGKTAEPPIPPKAAAVKQATLLNLSVDQVGLLARAADNARLIAGTSFSKICQDLAPHLATPEKEQISPASMRSNAYTGEDVDKHVVIRYLEKMIRLIKEY